MNSVKKQAGRMATSAMVAVMIVGAFAFAARPAWAADAQEAQRLVERAHLIEMLAKVAQGRGADHASAKPAGAAVGAGRAS